MFAEENGLHGDPRIKAISDAIRVVPHFPKKGIMFQDITTLLLDQKAFRYTVDIFVDRYRDKKISVVAGVEARGFIFGPPIALAIGAKFVPLRKPKKLPGEVISESYVLEYGTDCLEMHVGAVQPGERVLIVDDLVATGGTLSAAIRLLERARAEVVECACVIGLPFVKGNWKLNGVPLYVLVEPRLDDLNMMLQQHSDGAVKLDFLAKGKSISLRSCNSTGFTLESVILGFKSSFSSH
ncbi:hypothetical protein E3N88_21307 [Mikania micrantha]|uniref:adenine phosphoribosyltransferase n=1 Tax=Mikania micrantha TaxID=192012 RepID=A0A5N6NJW2_9ASTR|nr:hypothetical protein E3N88_21307 [Mikania micrantha]